ncbi:C3a anaphylatoxin chemotactic receptor-like [Hyla sarda]|uniref:C3a anaphylatoxin chemotactic receptor-like n=1 Tax=Hyla sarda TaxID=327740 RepID=UPI0024C3BA1B|nr:C3a anaphylatoxin chemotactic receptor-like [Hyla sarda]
MVVYLVFCLLGIIGNGLVIWFSIFRLKKTVNVVWYLSLAMADFSFAFFSPLNYTQVLLGYGGFQNMCKIIHFLLYSNVGISLLQITVISVDRCICVVFPIWCHNHRRPRLAFIVVLIIWTISFASSIFPILFSKISNVNERMVCSVSSDLSSWRRKKTILELVFTFLLPLMIIVFCYIVIIVHARRKRIITSSKPLKTSVAVIIVFFVCWFPIHLYYLLVAFGGTLLNSYVRYYSYLAAMLLVVLNSCINPVLYAFIGRDLKKKFCGSFQAKLEKAFIEEDKEVYEKQEGRSAVPSLRQDYKEKEQAEVIG